jgi:hypothetical protein
LRDHPALFHHTQRVTQRPVVEDLAKHLNTSPRQRNGSKDGTTRVARLCAAHANQSSLPKLLRRAAAERIGFRRIVA